MEDNENQRDTEDLIKSQKYNANIQAARRFLAMGEQRGSFCTSGAGSARSSYDPEADQYTAKYKDNTTESADKKT